MAKIYSIKRIFYDPTRQQQHTYVLKPPQTDLIPRKCGEISAIHFLRHKCPGAMQTFLHATIFPHVKELNMSYPFCRAKNGTNISHGLHFPNLHKFFSFSASLHSTDMVCFVGFAKKYCTVRNFSKEAHNILPMQSKSYFERIPAYWHI